MPLISELKVTIVWGAKDKRILQSKTKFSIFIPFDINVPFLILKNFNLDKLLNIFTMFIFKL